MPTSLPKGDEASAIAPLGGSSSPDSLCYLLLFATFKEVLKPTIFREYDIRGIAETELLSPDVADLGRGLGTKLRRASGNRVNLGRDCRLSSPRLRDALLEGLVSAGCEVTDIGVVPTPLLYYSAHLMEADGAVMITGSHNPAEI